MQGLNLIDVPKLVFINKCRGHETASVCTDGTETDVSGLVSGQNFHVAYSTSDGTVSWRDPAEGSHWFHVVVDVFIHNAAGSTIFDLMGIIRMKMATQFRGAPQGPKDENTLLHPWTSAKFN